MLLLAQVAAPASGMAGWVIFVILAAAVIGIALVSIRASGVVVPGWVMQIGWIVVVCLVAILAIRFLLSVAG